MIIHAKKAVPLVPLKTFDNDSGIVFCFRPFNADLFYSSYT